MDTVDCVDTTDGKKFDVIIVGGGDYYGNLPLIRSRFINALLKDDRFNVKLMTADEHSEEVKRNAPPILTWIDELTLHGEESLFVPPVEPVMKPRPYWRQGERW